MKIINQSKYSTKLARSLVLRAVAAVRKTEGKRLDSHTKFLIVGGGHAHRGGCGWAYLGQRVNELPHIKPEHLRLGHQARIVMPTEGATVGRFVYVAYHEAMHLWGFNHGEFLNLTREEAEAIAGQPYDTPFPLQPARVRAKPTLDEARDQRLARMDARLKAWRTKQRRAETAIAKLTRDRKRLARVIEQGRAATPPLPEAGGAV